MIYLFCLKKKMYSKLEQYGLSLPTKPPNYYFVWNPLT